MNDAQFLEALERCTLAPTAFDHAAHVRAGYLYLRRDGFARALERLSGAIRRFAATLDAPDKYHETITVAYLALIHQHMAERGDGDGWEGFRQANPELLDPTLLTRYYDPQVLHGSLARRLFVLPARQGSQPDRTSR